MRAEVKLSRFCFLPPKLTANLTNSRRSARNQLHSVICRNKHSVSNKLRQLFVCFFVCDSPPWPCCWFVRGFESAACWWWSQQCRLAPQRRPARAGLYGNARWCCSPAPPGGGGGEVLQFIYSRRSKRNNLFLLPPRFNQWVKLQHRFSLILVGTVSGSWQEVWN